MGASQSTVSDTVSIARTARVKDWFSLRLFSRAGQQKPSSSALETQTLTSPSSSSSTNLDSTTGGTSIPFDSADSLVETDFSSRTILQETSSENNNLDDNTNELSSKQETDVEKNEELSGSSSSHPSCPLRRREREEASYTEQRRYLAVNDCGQTSICLNIRTYSCSKVTEEEREEEEEEVDSQASELTNFREVSRINLPDQRKKSFHFERHFYSTPSDDDDSFSTRCQQTGPTDAFLVQKRWNEDHQLWKWKSTCKSENSGGGDDDDDGLKILCIQEVGQNQLKRLNGPTLNNLLPSISEKSASQIEIRLQGICRSPIQCDLARCSL